MQTERHRGDRHSTERYLQDMAKYPLLTPTEEIELGRLVKRARELKEQEGTLTREELRQIKAGDRAKQRMVEGNMRLVALLANKARNKIHTLELTDLMQEGAIGLMRAAELFDPERGYKFSTYAYWWIRQGINRTVGTGDRLIRRPSTVGELVMKLPAIGQRLTAELGRTPEKHELAAAAKTTVAELDTLAQRGSCMLSLDYAYGEDGDGTALIDIVQNPVDADVDKEDQMNVQMIEDRLYILEEQDQISIRKHYGLVDGKHYTLHEIGEEFGISKERVRQRIKMALRRVRVAIAQGLPPIYIHETSGRGAEATAQACSVPSLEPAPPRIRSISPKALAPRSALQLSA
tara:strand:+ start:868 stop:1911 length:1044 start_codon:yes stop_codon:yes gene_type:complete